MERRILTASEGKVFAYKNQDEIIVLGSTLYLGINDDGSRYFEVDNEERTQEVIENQGE